jgi:TRAP-type C4-dicarboxylate transport system permease large subunit
VFGGLFSGAFTATEAGGIGALLSFLVAGLKRRLTWDSVKNAVIETLVTTASLLIIAVGAALLTRFLALSGTTKFLSDVVLGFGADPAIILIMIALMYLAIGMFLEPIGAMLLTLPVIMPILMSLDYSLIWFGVVLTKFLEIGMITPPIGMNVFVIKGVVGDLVSTTTIFRGIMWFLVADIVVVGLLMAFPDVILYLPNLAE